MRSGGDTLRHGSREHTQCILVFAYAHGPPWSHRTPLYTHKKLRHAGVERCGSVRAPNAVKKRHEEWRLNDRRHAI
eukprot:ctg_3333.g557